MYTMSRTSLIDRLNSKKCDFCGNETGPFELHHINKLKNVIDNKTNPWLKTMISRRRKTITLCLNCHNKLHSNKL